MDSTFFMLFGGLIVAIFFIRFYIVPDVVCESLRKDISAPSTLDDPINGICSALGK